MRYSLKLFTWFQIPVYLHWSFFLILGYVGYVAFREQSNLVETILTFAVLLVVFTCVLLHEYGHALAARRYGVVTKDIILTPIGGIARLMGMPEKPAQEFVVAIAGPLVNVAIVLLLLIVAAVTNFSDLNLMMDAFLEQITGMFGEIQGEATGQTLLDSLSIPSQLLVLVAVINFFLFAFNLIPAFPMDGGRIFRSLMEMKLGKLTATKYASWLGQAIAIGFIWFGWQNEPHTLAFIGVFIFLAARGEYRSLKFDKFWEKTLVSDVMQRNFLTLSQFMTLEETRPLLEGKTKVPILLKGNFNEIEGVVDLDGLKEAFTQDRPSMILNQLKVRFTEFIQPEQPLLDVLELLDSRPDAVLAVRSWTDNQIVGILEKSDIFEAVRKG